nr:chaperone protein DnaJ 13 [Tanacetum cinerariifolium]
MDWSLSKLFMVTLKAVKNSNNPEKNNDGLASQIMAVTLPLNFFVIDTGKLKLHEGVRKSGFIAFVILVLAKPINYMSLGEALILDELPKVVVLRRRQLSRIQR